MRRISIAFTCLALMATGGLCLGDTVYVTTNGVGGGASWGAAAALTNALVVCQEGDQIWVEGGTYDGAMFTVATNNITLYGGFTNGMSTLGERNWTNWPATLDGENTRRVVSVTSTNSVLDGLTIYQGYPASNGGGIYKDTTGSLALVNCMIVSNNVIGTAKKGYGCYFDSCSVTMSNCVFFANGNGTAGDAWQAKGFGLYATDADVVVAGCIFSSNYHASVYFMRDGAGGAFYCDGGTLAVSNTVFVGNKTGSREMFTWSGAGGCGYLVGACSAEFKNCVFRGNRAELSGARLSYGGALYVYVDIAKTVTVENCAIAGSFATGNGGAFYVRSGNLAVENCTIVDNNANANGGALFVDGASVDVQNSIIWSNSASSGDEIYKASGDVSLNFVCLTSTDEDDIYGAVTRSNILTNNPLFATEYTDLHLRSVTSRWDSGAGVWTNDALHSPCIDVGAPAGDYSNEPADNGGRLNLGAYGNTAEASKSPVAAAPVVENGSVSTNLTSATLSGELISGTLSEITVYYGTNQSGLMAQDSVQVYPPQQTGLVFSVNVSGLLTNTLYYWACFATNGAGTNWASVSNFTTGAEPPGGGEAIIHVDKDAIAGAQNGENWLDAYLTLGAAVSAANADTNEIWVAAGTYVEGEEVIIATNLSIYGGFTGTESNRTDRSLSNEVAFAGSYAHRIFKVVATNVVLDGLIIRESGPTSHGGGIYKDVGGSLVLANCQLLNNRINANSRYGYGCYVDSGSLTMTDCTIANNGRNSGDSWRARGFGFYAKNVEVSVNSCTFSSNYHSSGYYMRDGAGGAFYCEGGTLTVSNTVFVGNKTGPREMLTVGGGGAGYITGACPSEFMNCVFRDNRAEIAGSRLSYGGALYVNVDSAKTVTVENCTIAGSFATENGGAFYAISGNMAINNCTIVDNNADENGGAFFVDGASVEVRNSIIWSNSAASGAELYKASGDVSLSFVCLTGTGEDDVYGTVTLSNVMTNNPLFSTPYTDLHLMSVTGRWDVVAGGWTNDAAQSPCVDAGDPVADYSNEPGSNGGRVNLGAYGNTIEASQSPTSVAPTVTNRAPTVLCNVATLRGELVTGTPSDVTFWYGTNQASLDNSSALYPPQETGAVFSVMIGDLSPNMQYWCTCFAANAADTNWAVPYTNFVTTAPPSGGADIIHVDKDAPSPVETGKDWYNAYKTLAAAVAAANADTNEIWVADGTYIEGAEVVIPTNMSIYGGFTGTESNRTDRSLTNEVAFAGSYAHRILKVVGTNVLIDGLTVRESGPTSHGGGIYKDTGGSLVLLNCQLLYNRINSNSKYGYGCYIASCSVTMSNCTFANNGRNPGDSWRAQGFGFYANDAEVTVNSCIFSNNYRENAYYMRDGRGGGFHCVGGALTVSDSTFVGNRAGPKEMFSGGGGAGYLAGACSAQFRNCAFMNNQAMNYGSRLDSDGGVLWVNVDSAATVTVVNCTMASNWAIDNGGAFYVSSGNLVVRNSILWTNEASGGTGDEIYATGANSDVAVEYSDLTGTNSTYVVEASSASIGWGEGILTVDPLFASSTDLHLQSKYGRWIGPAQAGWTNDMSVSPCIDAGDPESAYAKEPMENGGQINLGAYGNSVQASKSPPAGGSVFVIR